MKKCWRCGIEKAEDDYPYRDKERGVRQTTCKECARAQAKAWYQKNKERHQKTAAVAGKRWRAKRRGQLEQVLDECKARPCADCKQSFPACAMRFEPIGAGVTNKTLTEAIRRYDDPAAILELAAHFEVVCANCQSIRHTRHES